MYVSPRYYQPNSLDEALDLVFRLKGKASVLAGGTDLVIGMREERPRVRHVINIKHIPGLDAIDCRDREIWIGPLVTHQQLIQSVLPEELMMLKEGCDAVGTTQIRNVATIVGNICNASPSADTAPALLVLGAQVEIASAEGKRTVPIEEFFAGPFRTSLRHGELVTGLRILLPPSGGAVAGGAYLWLPKVTKTDETLAGAAVFLELDPKSKAVLRARVGLASVAPTPMRARQAEEFLAGKEIRPDVARLAGEIAGKEARPRSRAEYRRRLISALVEKAIVRAGERAAKRGAV
jgi:CO/xanthine dehydrogenase FAD-binding subunit